MKIKVTILSLAILLISAFTITAQSSNSKASKAKVVDLNEEKYASKSLDDILKKYKGKVIYLDFWASWCTSCKAMDKTTFKDEAVKARLEGYVFIKYVAEHPEDPDADAMLARIRPWREAYERHGRDHVAVTHDLGLQRFVLHRTHLLVAEARRDRDLVVRGVAQLIAAKSDPVRAGPEQRSRPPTHEVSPEPVVVRVASPFP